MISTYLTVIVSTQVNPDLVAKATAALEKMRIVCGSSVIAAGEQWRGFRSSPEDAPYEAVQSEALGTFYFSPDGTIKLYSMASRAPGGTGISSMQAASKSSQYVKALGYSGPTRVRRVTNAQTVYSIEVNRVYGDFESWQPGADFYLEIDARNGQLARFVASRAIQPDSDLRHFVGEAQARSEILAYLHQPFMGYETDLRLVHRRTGNGGQGLGKWNGDLEAKYRAFQGSLVWRGEYRSASNGVVEACVDARTGELTELNSFGGGMGVQKKNKPFAWGLG